MRRPAQVIASDYSIFGYTAGVYSGDVANSEAMPQTVVEGGGGAAPNPYITPPVPGGGLPGGGSPTPSLPPPFDSIQSGRTFWVTVNSPAAGADWRYLHTYDQPAFIRQIGFTLLTSAAVHSVTMVMCEYDNSGNRRAAYHTNLSQAQSIRSFWNMNPAWSQAERAAGFADASGLRMTWFPGELLLLPYYTFGTEAITLDAADQFFSIFIELQFM